MRWNNLTLFAIAFFVTIISFLLFVGATEHNLNGTLTNDIPQCQDSDGGRFFDIMGFVGGIDASGNPFNLDDFCSDSNLLIEFYCDVDFFKQEVVECQFGCLEGICLEQSYCDDSDGGTLYKKKGFVSGIDAKGIQYEDSDICVSSSQLREFYCDVDLPKREVVECPFGCLDGTCLEKEVQRDPIENKTESKEPFCDESDGGRFYDIRGSIRGIDDLGNPYEEADICLSSIQLRELYCDLNFPREEIIDCPFGCLDDVCLKQEVRRDPIENITTPPQESFCEDSDGGKVEHIRAFASGIDSSGNYFEAIETCIGIDRLNEFYCQDNVLRREEIYCNFGCERGTCVESDEQNISEYFNEPFERKEYIFEDITEEEKELLKKELYEAVRLEDEALKMEEEFRLRYEGEDEFRPSPEEEEELRRLEEEIFFHEIRQKVIEEVTKEIYLTEERDKAIIEEIIQKPELVVEAELRREDVKDIIEIINKKILERKRSDQILEKLEETQVTLEQVDKELKVIKEEIENDLILLEKQTEETLDRYEETIKNIEIKKTINFLETKDEATEKEENISIITISIIPEKTLINFSVFEEIPKDLAANISEIIFFDSNYEVLESDPLIVWQFAALKSEVKISYGIKKMIDPESIMKTTTIPITDKVEELSLKTEESNLFKILFPIFITLFIIFIVLSFHYIKDKK